MYNAVGTSSNVGKLHNVAKEIRQNEKRSEATQTLRAGCNKADPCTNQQTNKHTDRDDLVRSVMK